MRYSCKVEAVAMEQLLDAAHWYDEQSTGLGDELALCFDEAIGVLKRNPNFQIRHK